MLLRNKTLKTNRKGFSLVELLIVISIIVIILGIGMAVSTSVRNSALKVKTKAQYSGWMAAMEQYKQIYGYFPPIGNLLDSGGPVNLNNSASSTANGRAFILALSGRDPVTGVQVGEHSQASLNRKSIRFYSFSEDQFEEINSSRLVDAFGNPNIFIKVDHNDDGLISLPDQVANRSGVKILRGSIAIWSLQDIYDQYEDVFSW